MHTTGQHTGYPLPPLQYLHIVRPQAVPHGFCQRQQHAVSQFKTLKETWLYTLDPDSITSLEQFNGFLRDYMRTYNTSVHSGIGTTPMGRYQQARSAIRMPKSREWLEECFLNRITRKVNKDSTASIKLTDHPIKQKRGNCALFLPSSENGFGQSPKMGQGTSPLRVLKAEP